MKSFLPLIKISYYAFLRQMAHFLARILANYASISVNVADYAHKLASKIMKFADNCEINIILEKLYLSLRKDGEK